MKKKLLAGLAAGFYIFGLVGIANALSLETTASQEFGMFSDPTNDSDSATSGIVTSAVAHLGVTHRNIYSSL